MKIKDNKNGTRTYELKEPNLTHYGTYFKFRSNIEKEKMPDKELIQTLWAYIEQLSQKLDEGENRLRIVESLANNISKISKEGVL